MWNWDEREIFRYLGYRGQEPAGDVRRLIHECERELEMHADLRSYWREYPLILTDDEINMTVLRTKSRALMRNLKNCESVILFAATLGSGVDVLLHRYGRFEMSRCVVLQAAAAAMLETWCDEENNRLKEDYGKHGLYLRPRFSPGYGDFPLECQKPFFEALELNKRIGITLTDSFLMAPSKSVTAVIGVSKMPSGCILEGCEACGKTGCEYRRCQAG
ncbi:MAG: Vitamin B12 dependent methionine synthase activation subunit [Clostridiales bacterium]|nr:Vitamin B12 dependent methionine synthase activation subunit [Clostridiales bacterium]